MDDLQFRRSIYADPQCTDEDIIQAVAADPSKQKFLNDVQQFDEKLLAALKVPVPDDMAQKLILQQALNSHQQDKKKTKVHLALAASVAITAGLVVKLLMFTSTHDSVAEYAFAHTAHEADYFTNNDDTNVTLASLNEKMTSFSGNFTDKLGDLIFADYCRFDGIKSLHLVYKGITSPVNVFIIPKNDKFTYTQSFSNNRLNGRSEQYKDADVIVVGDKSEPLQKWQENIKATVTWSI